MGCVTISIGSCSGTVISIAAVVGGAVGVVLITVVVVSLSRI